MTDGIPVSDYRNEISDTDTLQIGRESILAQSAALASIAAGLGPEFDAAVQLIVQSTGLSLIHI